MPKLDLIHIAERLQERLADLKAGKEVAAREIRALLNDEQLAAMDAAWTEQQELRKKSRYKNSEEEKALGWKTKREVFIAAYEKAVKDLDIVKIMQDEMRKAEIRRARIYFESYGKAVDEGTDIDTAKNIANNNLTRAGLNRLDGVKRNYHSKRDREVREMEDELRRRLAMEDDSDT